MNDVEIVGAADVHWQDYRALRLEALRKEPQAFGSSYADNLAHPDTYWQGRLADAAAARSNWLLFARQNGQLVGMLGAFQDEAMATERSAFVIAMYVTAAARGLGISRQLMSALLATLEGVPTIQRLRLAVNTKQTMAVRLYERMGFVTVEREHVRLGDGNFHDGYIMERPLG